jgi:hypothetical protein
MGELRTKAGTGRGSFFIGTYAQEAQKDIDNAGASVYYSK